VKGVKRRMLRELGTELRREAVKRAWEYVEQRRMAPLEAGVEACFDVMVDRLLAVATGEDHPA
jgi:hypothetical protein